MMHNMAGSKKQKEELAHKKKVYKRTAILSIVVIVVFDILIGGNIVFYSKWISCGQKPIVTNQKWRMEGDPPYYEASVPIKMLRGLPDYFCTPLEAEKAGYSANENRYDFPHLSESRQVD